MAKFSYTKNTTTTLKAVGVFDYTNGTIYVDDTEKSLKTLFSDFDGANIELVIKVKENEELDEPLDEE